MTIQDLKKYNVYTDKNTNGIKMQFTGYTFFQSQMGDTPAQMAAFEIYIPNKKDPMHFLNGRKLYRSNNYIETFFTC